MADTYFNSNSKQAAVRRSAPWQAIADKSLTADTLFEVAADQWLSFLSPKEEVADMPIGRRPMAHRIRKNTARSYVQYVSSLKLFFGGMTLGEIRLDHIRQFEDARVAGSEPFVRKRRPNKTEKVKACPASPRKANTEIGILKRILRAAKLWGLEEEQLHTILAVEESEVPRALSRGDQMLWLKVASSEPRWHLVYWYSVLAFATCMGTNEIRSLRIGDINLDSGVINISWAGSKNIYRHRSVSIGGPGDNPFEAVRWLLDRAKGLGARDSNHYLFPFRNVPFPFDPTQPMSVSGIRVQWDEVRKATRLAAFRPYDTRHTAITRLAEENVPIATIMDMAGHISAKMTKHYTHISDGLKVKAMRQVHRSIWNGPSDPEPTPYQAGGPTAPIAYAPRRLSPAPVEVLAPPLPAARPQSAASLSGTFSQASYFFMPQVSRTA